jgi:signal peptidase I
MEPTLLGHDHPAPAHDHLFLNKMVFRMRDPVQGEICVFRAPKVADVNAQLTGQPPQENVLIKRAVAIGPGSVEVKPDAAGQLKVWVNGKVTEEPYIAEPMQETGNEKFALNGPLYLKEGQIFMMGDNRNRSSDSRYWGPVERSRVIGRAEVIFWPLNRIGRLR